MAELTQAEIDALLRGEEIVRKTEENTGELDITKFADEPAPPPVALSDIFSEIESVDEETEDIFQHPVLQELRN